MQSGSGKYTVCWVSVHVYQYAVCVHVQPYVASCSLCLITNYHARVTCLVEIVPKFREYNYYNYYNYTAAD